MEETTAVELIRLRARLRTVLDDYEYTPEDKLIIQELAVLLINKIAWINYYKSASVPTS